jgi:hypothetical protein
MSPQLKSFFFHRPIYSLWVQVALKLLWALWWATPVERYSLVTNDNVRIDLPGPTFSRGIGIQNQGCKDPRKQAESPFLTKQARSLQERQFRDCDKLTFRFAHFLSLTIVGLSLRQAPTFDKLYQTQTNKFVPSFKVTCLPWRGPARLHEEQGSIDEVHLCFVGLFSLVSYSRCTYSMTHRYTDYAGLRLPLIRFVWNVPIVN